MNLKFQFESYFEFMATMELANDLLALQSANQKTFVIKVNSQFLLDFVNLNIIKMIYKAHFL